MCLVRKQKSSTLLCPFGSPGSTWQSQEVRPAHACDSETPFHWMQSTMWRAKTVNKMVIHSLFNNFFSVSTVVGTTTSWRQKCNKNNDILQHWSPDYSSDSMLTCNKCLYIVLCPISSKATELVSPTFPNIVKLWLSVVLVVVMIPTIVTESATDSH